MALNEQEEFELLSLEREKSRGPSSPTVSGVAAEGVKGLLRGASDVAQGVGKTLVQSRLGPVGGAAFDKVAEVIGGPSRSLVEAKPDNPTEKFVGTASEIVGGSAVGGGVGSLKAAAMTGAAALGGAGGEQANINVGGVDVGKILGIVAGVAGTAAAAKVAQSLGSTAKDIGATVGASFGNKSGIERMASDAVTKMAGDQPRKVVDALSNVSDVGPIKTELVAGVKPSVGEVITQAQMGKPEQFGGALIRLQKDLYGARGVEDVLPTFSKQQASAIENHLTNLNATTAPMREKALDSASVMGVKPWIVTNKIDEALKVPGARASEVVKKTLDAVKEKINSLPGAEMGAVNAHDLYTVRKEVGNTIQKYAAETANWDKKVTAGLERNVQKYIDNAIEAAGGAGWRDYLKTYSSGMRGVQAQEARLEEMQNIAKGVKGQPPGSLVSGEIPQPPTLLSRPMMLVNFALKVVARDANTPVAREIATRMQIPGEFAKLIKLPSTDPKRIAAESIANRIYGAVAASQPQ